MSEHLERARSYHAAIREVLMREWDPIGVANIPEAADEYDSYISQVYVMLIRREPLHMLVDFLWSVETKDMGLAGNRCRTKRTAERLSSLRFIPTERSSFGVTCMASTAPVVWQIAWISVVPHLAIMAILMAGAYYLGITLFIEVGAVTYLGLSFGLRYSIPLDHRFGAALLRKESFDEAIPHFQRSYEFFTRHRWLDDWRFLTLLSSSRISYRELALLNIAHCYGQMGDGERSYEFYQRVVQEFPGSRVAESALRLFEAARKTSKPDATPTGGLGMQSAS